MKEIKVIGGNWSSYHYYNSIDEFIDKLDELKDWLTSFSWDCSLTSGPKWAWTRNYQAALDLQYGFEIKWEPFKFAKKDGSLSIEYNSFAGGRVNIWAYLSWVPENMIHNDILPEKKKLRVMYHIGWTFGFSNEELMVRAKIIFGSLQELEKQYSVEVYCAFSSNMRGKKVGGIIKIKEFGGRFIRNRFAFTLHTWFFRRLCFRYFETRSELPSGYGSEEIIPEYLRKQFNIDVYLPEIDYVKNNELKYFINNKVSEKILTNKEKRI